MLSATAVVSGTTAAARVQHGDEQRTVAANVPLAGNRGCHADGSGLDSVTGASLQGLQNGDVCMIEVHEVEDSE